MARRHYRKDRALTPATVLMLIAAIAFLIFCAATRWGLDTPLGPWLYDHMQWMR